MGDQLSLGVLENDLDSALRSSPLPTPSLLEANIPDELRCVSILEILSSDPRPSFVIDLEDVQVNGWRPIYANNACTTTVANLVVRDEDGVAPFRAWACDESVDRLAQYRHNSKLWSSYNLRGRWRVISGTRLHDPADGDAPDSSSEGVSSPTGSWVGASSRSSTFQSPEEDKWVDSLPQTSFVQDKFIPNDWRNTPLGPMANWSYLLRRSVRFVLADPGAACIFWGDKHCCIYNESYAEIMGTERAATGQGRPTAVVWPEVYPELVPIFKEVRKTRQACGWKNVCFNLVRNGLLVETFWDWNLIPMMEDRGVGSGFYSSIHETTSQFLSVRRAESMLKPVHARNTISFWAEIQDNFSKNRLDAPFAAFYDVRRPRRLSQDSDGMSGVSLPQRCVLRGGLGIPDGHGSFPFCADLRPHSGGVIPYLAEAAGQRESLILTRDTHPDFFDLLNGIEWGGYELPSHTVVIFCLRLGTDITGFLVLGINPRRSYNDEEHRFVDALDNHLSASLSSAALIERFHDNEQRLERRLAQSLEQAEMSDARYRAITELSPLGMINTLPNGGTIYANRRWYEITGHPPEADYSKVNFRTIIHEDDLPLIDTEFEKMVNGKQRTVYELRLKKRRFDPKTHVWHDRWILCTGGPEYDDNGQVRSVIGCITEITAQKLAENLQSRSRQAAEEAKAAQEKFMDATSHEMRNPLSAILQSADEISTSLKEATPQPDGKVLMPRNAFDTCAEAAEVITLCAQHQTRIVDDVLTMSKIDSHMLEVTPIPAQPLNVVKETMQMYHVELQSNKIDTEVVIEPAWDKSAVDWVLCDPARLRQILINLVSNAIKFTRQEAKRKITINVTASVSKPPTVQISDIKWFPSNNENGTHCVDMTTDPSWGDGEIVYFSVVISDTGKGLSEKEKDKLFNRFAQANTLTHIHYGGSGLGLFISRELTEMHGGEIGVASKSGSGSAFAFYIKCRRVPAPRPQAPLRSNSGQLVAQVAGLVVPLPKDTPEAKSGFLSAPQSIPKVISAVSESTTRPGLFVLVVEDNLINQRVMAKQLVKAGCTVAVANHGREALDYLTGTVRWSACTAAEAKRIDIALVDIEMPVMNGLTCARRIRQHQADGELLGHLPLMAVTANARKEQVAECLAAGMDDVTIKPFKVSDLLAKAKALIDNLEQHQQEREQMQDGA